MVNQKNGKGMTIKELKERIKDLPDDMEIAIDDPEYESQHVTWMGEEKDVLTFGLIK